MTEGAPLDHAVINVKFEMDRAAPLFEGLGLHRSHRAATTRSVRSIT